MDSSLYPLHLPLAPQNSWPTSPSAFSCTRTSSLLWHHWLGHPSSQVFKAIASSLPLHGSSNLPSVCTACQLGKSSRLPFQCSSSISGFPLSCCTPMSGVTPRHLPLVEVAFTLFLLMIIVGIVGCFLFNLNLRHLKYFCNLKPLLKIRLTVKSNLSNLMVAGNSQAIGLKFC